MSRFTARACDRMNEAVLTDGTQQRQTIMGIFKRKRTDSIEAGEQSNEVIDLRGLADDSDFDDGEFARAIAEGRTREGYFADRQIAS